MTEDNKFKNNRKILVGNVPEDITPDDLRDASSKAAGSVISVSVNTDSRGRAGHAFVEMASREEALTALDALNGLEIHGRTLNLSIADQPGDETQSKKRSWFKFW